MKTRLAMLTFVMLALTSCAPVLAATPTLTFVPTRPATPSPLPGAVQTALWKKYQTELARVVLAWYGPKFGFPPDYYKSALCEWDVLGRTAQLVYVWAYCGVSGGGEKDMPAVIYLNERGYPQKAEVPGLDTYQPDVSRMFPADVQAKFDTYMGSSLASGRLHEMVVHVSDRYAHPDEPPLIVLNPVSAP